MALLDIRNLTIEHLSDGESVKIVNHLSLTLAEGEFRGLVGESGSGKSLVAKAICGVSSKQTQVTADRIWLDGVNLASLTAKKRRKLIGKTVSMIYQDAQSCLDPAEKIGKQLKQAIPFHTFKGRWWQFFYWKNRKAIELLHRVGLKEHEMFLNCYPYELTDSECQKVMIAIALANQPKLIIADEPTASMDAVYQQQIFRLLSKMNQNHGTTILLISHNLRSMKEWASKISVMYCGQIVEVANSQELLDKPHHPYTQALIRSMPNFLDPIPHKSPLNSLKGTIPSLEHLPKGCRLGPRCPYAQRKCIETPPLRNIKNRFYACHFPLNIEESN